MAKVILICGRICSGKSTYAEALRRRERAVVLSVDELALAVFDPYLGDKHDMYMQRVRDYLLKKAVEIVEVGTNVVLDWGFWTRADRDATRAFFAERNIEHAFHYIDVCDDVWRERIAKRNAAVQAGEAQAYFVDENLAAKFASRFEKPEKAEMDEWIAE